MVRTLGIIKIVIWILILALCCWFLFGAIFGNLPSFGFDFHFPFIINSSGTGGSWSNAELVEEEKTVDAAGIDTVLIDTAAYRCIVETHDGTDIRVLRNGDKDRPMKVSVTGGQLAVSSNEEVMNGFKPWNWFNVLDNGSITVYLPKSYSGSLSVNTASGSVQFSELPLLESVSVDTASGSISLQDLSVQKDIDIDTASGSVSGGAFTADRVSVDTASGSIKFDGLAVNRFDIGSASGSVTVDGATGGGNIETMSGRITLEYTASPTSDVELSTASGSIRCKLPENADFTAKFDTMSGGIDSDFAATLSGKREASVQNGSGGAEINISTMSGSIRLEKGPAA